MKDNITKLCPLLLSLLSNNMFIYLLNLLSHTRGNILPNYVIMNANINVSL